jgi:2-dehydropantoate 2-reductase
MEKVLILGTGALATLFAARLGASGVPVMMLGSWENALASLERDGARLVQANGAELSARVQVARSPSECLGANLALVLVKAWQTERTARQLAECLAPDGLAVSLQNGLGNRERLALALGEERAALGVTTTGATMLGPGLARSGGDGRVSLEAHPRISRLESLLEQAGFDVEIVPNADSLAWGKLVINAAINPLTAILGVPNGELLARRSARQVMHTLAREAASVAGAWGVSLPFPDPARAAEDVARRTASNRSSMFQDVRRGARTEIDSISGAVVRAGQQKGCPAPINWTMWQLVRALAH